MAITAVTTYAVVQGGSFTSISTNVNVPSSNMLMIATIGQGVSGGGSSWATTVTFGGSTVSLINSTQCMDNNFCGVNGWYLFNPVVTNMPVLASLAHTAFYGAMHVTLYSGTVSTNIFTTTRALSNDTSSDPIDLIVNSATGEVIHTGICTDAATVSTTGNSLAENENVASDISIGTAYYAGGASVTTRWDLNAAVGGAMYAVSIAASTGAGGTPALPFMIGDLTGIGSPGRFFKDRLQ